MSATVKAYFCLKMIGEDIEAPHMRRPRGDPHPVRRGQRQRLHPLPAGPLRRSAVARRAGHAVEIMFLPKWFPFHIDKVSYWARCTMVPMFVLQATKPRAKNPAASASRNCS